MHKLTLRMKAELVNNAKEYAALHGKSLSQLVADYFEDLTREPAENKSLPPLTESLKGILAESVQSQDDESYKKHLEDKYL